MEGFPHCPSAWYAFGSAIINSDNERRLKSMEQEFFPQDIIDSNPPDNEALKALIAEKISELNGLIDSRIRMLHLAGSPLKPELLFAEARSTACAQILVAAGIVPADLLELKFKEALMAMLDSASRPAAPVPEGGIVNA